VLVPRGCGECGSTHHRAAESGNPAHIDRGA
jgi:hypothetical protein